MEASTDWLGSDLLTCRVFEEFSRLISASCCSFSAQLEEACKHARQQLPGVAEGSTGPFAFDCAESSLALVTAVGSLASAVRRLAEGLDLELATPLQKTVATLHEESAGRVKHWRQVSSRFADLQEQYRRTRHRCDQAKGRLAAGASSEGSRWSWRKAVDSKAASEQHTALRDLARCEEELLGSEVALRELEEQSRQRLRELDMEKKATLRSSLAVALGFLQRLLFLPEEVFGQSTPQPESQQPLLSSDGDKASSEDSSDGDTTNTTSSSPEEELAKACFDEAKTPDPSAKYLRNCSGMSPRGRPSSDGQPIDLLLEDETAAEADAAVRAARWSPPTSSGSKSRSIIFNSQSSGMIVVAPRGSDSTSEALLTSVAAAAATPQRFLESAGAPSFAPSPQEPEPESDGHFWREVALGQTPPMSCNATQADFEGDSEDSDGANKSTPQRAKVPCLVEPDVELEVTPMIEDQPQKSFERYVRRVPDRLAAGTECAWDKLLAASLEHLTGGHVGKIELFWIHKPGMLATPDTADGLVCFQFVQGCASNFARVLHLSVSPCQSIAEEWPKVLPSAVFAVKRLVFGTLPVDSLRAVVYAPEDDSGRIYFDQDVESAYIQCQFRWFQLNQSLRRTGYKYSFGGRSKVHSVRRSLVFASQRSTADPQAPLSTIGRLPALLLRSAVPDLETPDLLAQEDEEASSGSRPAAGVPVFTAW